MRDKLRLSEATELFVLSMSAQGRAPNTLQNYRGILRRFQRSVGDLYVGSINGTHVDRHFILARPTRQNSTLGVDHAVLSRFFGWLESNRYIPRFTSPMDGRKAPRAAKKERNRLEVGKFPALLDAAGEHHPRDRMVVALGLYLFLRGGEIVTLRVGDVKLDSGEVSVFRHKTGQADQLPISSELDRELRSWLTYYSQEQGRLNPMWYLVPARLPVPLTRGYRGRLQRVEDGGMLSGLNPTAPITRIHEPVSRALSKIGYPLRDQSGRTLGEGVHTLRRSAARARFDALERLGYDGAIRHVQTMLGHATMAMTEHYLGLHLDRVKRNDLVKGRPMFFDETTVVSLDSLRTDTDGEKGDDRAVV